LEAIVGIMCRLGLLTAVQKDFYTRTKGVVPVKRKIPTDPII